MVSTITDKIYPRSVNYSNEFRWHSGTMLNTNIVLEALTRKRAIASNLSGGQESF